MSLFDLQPIFSVVVMCSPYRAVGFLSGAGEKVWLRRKFKLKHEILLSLFKESLFTPRN